MKCNTKPIAASSIFLGLLMCSQLVMSMDADDAPQTVVLDSMKELYHEVIFNHEMHVERYGCSTCHHHTTGDGPTNKACNRCHATSIANYKVSCSDCHLVTAGVSAASLSIADNTLYHIDKPGLKGALHLQCLGCHKTESGPTGCQECHAFTAAGRKRFLLQE